MMDDLEKLRAALNAATPTPDADAKTANLRTAQENFDRAQGSTSDVRPTSENRPTKGRFMTGVGNMLHTLTSRGGMVATTALVAVGLIVISPQGRSLLTPPGAWMDDRDMMSDRVRFEDRQASVDELPAEPTMEAPVLSNEAFESEADAVTGRMAAPSTMPMSAKQGSGGIATLVAPAPDRFIIEPEANTETFANETPNPLKVTIEEPVSTFSIDVDTASYAVVRSSLTNGFLPPADAVRVEEMINYFNYDYPAPRTGGDPFTPTVSVMPTPWNADTQLVHIALQGELPALEDRPPLNLVFLIDTSGSMQDTNKLPLLKQSFRLMLGQLRPTDQVAIVTYAGSAGQVLEPTPAGERSIILAALDRLEAGGSTAGQAGLQQAYAVAEAMTDEGDVTRVLLATDGDFNVGISDPDALKDFIADKRDTGTYLSVLGFGRGNLDDTTMQALAQNGNGQAAYIDTLSEAQKVLVDQLSGALFPIANDVKIQMEFNPATVAEYRLIGYETRALNREDFNNDKVDAGEIGAGHSVIAIYEITPVGSPAVLNTPLRYETEAVAHGDSDELGFLRLRYKTPGASVSELIETPILAEMGPVSVDAQFGVAIAGFGQLLRGSNYLGDWSWGDAIALATENRGNDQFGYRAEAISLMRLAESLSKN